MESTSSTIIELSADVLERLNHAGCPQDQVCLWAPTDLGLSGQSEQCWVVASRECLYVLDGRDEPVYSVKMEAVEEFRNRGTIGSGFLQAHTDSVLVDLARYSNQQRELFVRFTEQLEALRKGEEFSIERVYQPSDRVCPKCELPLPQKNAPCPRCIKQGAVFVRTFKMLRGYLGWVLVLFALMMAGIAFDMLPPYLTRILVDDVLGIGKVGSAELPEKENLLIWVVGGLVGAAVCRQGLNIVIGLLSTRVGLAITFDVRRKVFEKFQTFAVDYYDRHPVGNLMQRVTGDSEAFYGFVNQIASGFLLNILRLIAIGIMLFYMDWRLASFVLIPVPFVIFGTTIYWRKIYPRHYKLSDASAKVSSLINGIFSGIRVVKAFSQDAREHAQFVEGIDHQQKVRKWVNDSGSMFSPIMALVFSMGGFIVWYAGGRLVLEDRGVTLGTLMAFLGYLGMFYGPLQGLSELSTWTTSFLASSQRIFDILDTPTAIEDSPDAVRLPAVKGTIEFEDVTFGYDPYSPVLKDISMRIEPGQFIGIVGKSGSGKSTLINLLCRFYDVQKGSVKIDGIDVRELRREDLRAHVGLVLQEPFLFRATITQNIAYGRPSATPHEIMDAAKAAYAHDFIMRQPLGYDTQLGERGAGLSGGERQRISLARAILYDPGILVLDEATSSVDTESEQEIRKALSTICEGRTSIAIAHRLTTLQGADCIYVIDEGRLAESGSHDELMALEGIYWKLVKIQTELTKLEE